MAASISPECSEKVAACAMAEQASGTTRLRIMDFPVHYISMRVAGVARGPRRNRAPQVCTRALRTHGRGAQACQAQDRFSAEARHCFTVSTSVFGVNGFRRN